MASEEKGRLVTLHSPLSLKSNSHISHGVIFLKSRSSLRIKDKRIRPRELLQNQCLRKSKGSQGGKKKAIPRALG